MNNTDDTTLETKQNPIRIKASELKRRLAPNSIANKAPQKVTKEELQKTINDSIHNIKDHSEAFHKLIDSLQLVARNDISFATLDDVKRVLAGFDPIKKQVLSIKNTLDRRARTKLQEG